MVGQFFGCQAEFVSNIVAKLWRIGLSVELHATLLRWRVGYVGLASYPCTRHVGFIGRPFSSWPYWWVDAMLGFMGLQKAYVILVLPKGAYVSGG